MTTRTGRRDTYWTLMGHYGTLVGHIINHNLGKKSQSQSKYVLSHHNRGNGDARDEPAAARDRHRSADIRAQFFADLKRLGGNLPRGDLPPPPHAMPPPPPSSHNKEAPEAPKASTSSPPPSISTTTSKGQSKCLPSNSDVGFLWVHLRDMLSTQDGPTE